MGLFSNLNRGRKFAFELPEKLSNENYLPIKECNGVYVVKSIYKNTKAKYGEHYVVLAEQGGVVFGINLPKFCNDTVLGILQNDEMVEAINSGRCGISRSEEMEGANGKYFTAIWHDIEDDEIPFG